MKIYLLYTGGTVGCVGTPLSPLQGDEFFAAFKTLVEPTISRQIPDSEITYDFFDHTLDSTNMQPSDWILIAQKILGNYTNHDVFLVLHGTDTMAWTVSALSFLLPCPDKPITVTGSQLPLFFQVSSDIGEPLTVLFNTDALRNILGAIGFFEFGMPEIGIYFADVLYRGNRSVKSNANEFNAFSSPNYPALGQSGVINKPDNTYTQQLAKKPAFSNNILKIKEDINTIATNIKHASVAQFMLFPAYYDNETSFLVSILDNYQKAKPALRGIVFEAYGQGNIPDYQAMQDQLKNMHDEDNIVLIDCTQVYKGDVHLNHYCTGAWLKNVGIISGGDMTPVAALAKLIILFARNPKAPISEIESQMAENLAGELTEHGCLPDYQ